MIPSAFVQLAEFPLTANGKVDRKRLPAAELNRDELAAEFVAAATPTEETVAAIWAQVLKLERVGVLDNFFELGGHSLLATQVMFALREALRGPAFAQYLRIAHCIGPLARNREM